MQYCKKLNVYYVQYKLKLNILNVWRARDFISKHFINSNCDKILFLIFLRTRNAMSRKKNVEKLFFFEFQNMSKKFEKYFFNIVNIIETSIFCVLFVIIH